MVYACAQLGAHILLCADAVAYCATRPLHVNVSEIIVMPTAQAAVTMIARDV